MRAPGIAVAAAAAVALAATGACTGSGRPAPARPAEPALPPLAHDAARLTIPAGKLTGAALAHLARRAGRGEVRAAWVRAHYLLDLFDDARFRGDDASLVVLDRALAPDERGGGARAGRRPAISAHPQRGPAATDRAIRALLVEVDRVLALARMHAGAQAAKTLLEIDAHPPRDRAHVFQHMNALKEIARGGGPVAANAKLRMFAFCHRAFADAARAPWARRPRMLDYCLYPLFDADPDRYFVKDPAARPPTPDWHVLAHKAPMLLADIVEHGGRLWRAAAHQRRQFADLISNAATAFPTPPDAAALALPDAPGAAPYDFTPVFYLRDGTHVGAPKQYAGKLRIKLQGDRRGHVAIALAAHGPATAVVAAARAAIAAGATALDLLGRATRKVEIPQGDYWQGRLPGGTATRVVAVPVSLAPMGAPEQSGGGPRAVGWDPDRAALSLHLVVGPKSWQLVAPTGKVADIAVAVGAGDPRAALRAKLAEVRAAFPDEDGLVLVPGPGATYAALMSAATAAARDADGHPLFSRLALAAAAPAITAHTLARRIRRRFRARVVVDPATLAADTAAIRRCYQHLLETRPRLAAAFRLELSGGHARVVSGPKNQPLRTCVLRALAGRMQSRHIAAAVVTLAPR